MLATPQPAQAKQILPRDYRKAYALDTDYRATLERLRTQPPNDYIDSQFNRCPANISQHLDLARHPVGSVIDFGCGQGIKALSMALRYPQLAVVGIDITRAFDRLEDFSRRVLGIEQLPPNLGFQQIQPGQSLASVTRADFIYSWSVLEHVAPTLLADIIADFYESLNPRGLVFTQIAPLYFSPFGSHLREFADQPWAHLTLPLEDLRLQVHADDRPDLSEEERNRRRWMYTRFEALNKITAAEINEYFARAGFKCQNKILKRVSLRPSKALLNTYNREALLTNELFLLSEKK
tara:strand:- start:18963 stop:19841 length:879 start_codon:yes stop_codon:yes gene_type:complete